jgi:hypothetical protein
MCDFDSVLIKYFWQHHFGIKGFVLWLYKGAGHCIGGDEKKGHVVHDPPRRTEEKVWGAMTGIIGEVPYEKVWGDEEVVELV